MRKPDKKRLASRLDDIERKCDRILSELLIIRRQSRHRHDDVDSAIERMHRVARRMRAQCERERGYVRRMFIPESEE